MTPTFTPPATFRPGGPNFSDDLNATVTALAAYTRVVAGMAEGVSDTNTAAANTAALNARLAEGGHVFLPSGHYAVNDEILLGDDTALFSDGLGAVLEFPSSMAGDDFVGIRNEDQVSGNQRCRVHNIRVVGPENASLVTANVPSSPRGIYFNRVTDGAITDCHISRWNLQGIQADVCTRLKIKDNTVIEIKSGNGISIDANSVDVIVEGNTLADIADGGIGTHNGSTATVIKGNTITNTNYGPGIDVYGAPDTTIEGNTLRQIGGTGTAGVGVRIHPGLASTVPHRCQVLDNKIYQPHDQGVLVDASLQILDTTIEDNQIIDPGAQGIYISRLANGVDITGNKIRSATGAGVYLEHSGSDIPTRVFIDANSLLDNSTFGVQATASVTDIKLGENLFAGNGSQATDIPMPTVASTAAMTLPTHSGVVKVTGTANITSIVPGYHGERVTLIFTATAAGTGLTDGAGTLRLGSNFVYTADDAITLVCDGGAWYSASPGSAN